MEIIVGKTAGFCYGVTTAVEKSEEYVKKNMDRKVYCLGEIVHNKQVVEKLEQEGLIFIDKLEDLVPKINNDKISVIIRAHGEPKSTYEFLNNNKIEIVDLTCPNVLAIHNIVSEYVENGYNIFLIGQKNHPETIGTAGFCKDKCFIIENEEDISTALKEFLDNNKKTNEKILIVAQTTFSLAKFNKFAQEIENKLNQNESTKHIKVEVRNTICNATRLRQEETEKISKEVDYMIIIGGKNSSNTRKLYDIAKNDCKDVSIIETYIELKEFSENIKNKEKIGIMAGASTPNYSINEVIDFIKSL